MSATHRQSVPSSATAWRIALLMLAIVLGLTNVVALVATFRPHYWDQVGLIGISGTAVNGKLRVSPDIIRGQRRLIGFTGDLEDRACERGRILTVLKEA